METSMSFNYLIYPLLIGILFIVPQKFYWGLYQYGVEFRRWFFQIKKGNELLEQINDTLSSSSFNQGISKTSLETELQYKFYTDLVKTLLRLSKTYGGGNKHFLEGIKNGLVQDIRFEKKIQGLIFTGLIQFMMVAFVTWALIFFSIEMNLKKSGLDHTVILVLIIQLLGGGFFLIFVPFIRNWFFGPINNYFKCFYHFSALHRVGIPVDVLIKKSQIDQIICTKTNYFKYVNKRTKKMLHHLHQSGGPIQNELDMLVQELWFLSEECFQKFLTTLTGFKFFVLAFFYLGAYLYYLFQLGQGLVFD